MLRRGDLFVICKLVHWPRFRTGWVYDELARVLHVSSSVAHEAVQRGNRHGLLEGRRVDTRTLLHFLEHALHYLFSERPGGWTRGKRTGRAVLRVADPTSPPEHLLVWPDPSGKDQGRAFQPLHRSANKAIRFDANFMFTLAMIDVLRDTEVNEDDRREALLRLHALCQGVG